MAFPTLSVSTTSLLVSCHLIPALTPGPYTTGILMSQISDTVYSKMQHALEYHPEEKSVTDKIMTCHPL